MSRVLFISLMCLALLAQDPGGWRSNTSETNGVSAVTAVSSANAAVTATVSSVAGQFHYITAVHIVRTCTTAITGSGIGTFKLQSQTHKHSSDKDMVRDADGIEVQATLYNPTEEASFEYVVSGATGAAAITASVIPAVGALVTVSNASQYTPIAASTWFVWDDPQISFSNTSAAKVTLHLKRWTGTGGITAVST